jgi:hypothetical protein
LNDSDINKGLAEFNAQCPREENLSMVGLDVHTELDALCALRITDPGERKDTLEVLHELVNVMSTQSPMFNPVDELQQGRRRLALGMLHYWDCFYLEPGQWPSVPNSTLINAEEVMSVAREVDRCRATGLFTT